MSALQKFDPSTSVHAPTAETVVRPDAMLQALVRIASDPQQDMARFEWAINMHERLQAQEAKRQYDEAMAVMQPEIPTIDERGQITGRNSFAKWDDINKVIKPILSKHGFSLTHRRADASDGQLALTAILAHRAGHREETTLNAAPDKSGGKNDIQAIGSALSYLQRYTAKLLINFTSAKSEDDDGGPVNGADAITEAQAMDLRDLLQSTGANTPQFLKAAKVDRLEDIPAKNFDALCAVVKRRAAERNA